MRAAAANRPVIRASGAANRPVIRASGAANRPVIAVSAANWPLIPARVDSFTEGA